MKTYRLSKRAEKQLEEIVDYIAQYNPSGADRVLEALYATFESLARNPNVGEKRDDLHEGLRVFPGRRPAHHYVILFRLEDEVIEVSHVVHGSRDWPSQLTRGEL